MFIDYKVSNIIVILIEFIINKGDIIIKLLSFSLIPQIEEMPELFLFLMIYLPIYISISTTIKILIIVWRKQIIDIVFEEH
jgi:hypothetical protein